MKKIILMALVAVAANSATAQDLLKQISKADNYQAAEELLNGGLSTLSDAAKAKAYYSVFEKAMKKYNQEATIVATNAAAAQLKTGKEEPYDTVGMYNALDKAYEAAALCYKYDQLPNEKGKISPKFDSKLANNLWPTRNALIQAGQWCGDKRDNAGVVKYFGQYVDSYSDPIFANYSEAKNPDPNMDIIAANAARFAYFEKQYDKAVRYAEIAEKNPEYAKEATIVKINAVKDQAKTNADSVAVADQLQKMYDADPSNDAVFATLQDFYNGLGQKDKASALLDSRLSKNPNDAIALEMRGQSYYFDGKYDEAIADFTKALQTDTQNAAVNLLAGVSYIGKAQKLSDSMADKNGNIKVADNEKVKAVYKEAIPFLEKARELDPDQLNTKWAYYLYNAYYFCNGANDPKTKELEAITQGK